MVAKLSEFKAKCTENRKLGIERKEKIVKGEIYIYSKFFYEIF